MASMGLRVGVMLGAATIAGAALAQAPTEQESAAQKAAIARLAPLDGLWRGTATVTANGKSLELVHTERVGALLGGTVEVIEGRSYRTDGSDAGFNALAVISCTSSSGGCEMRSYAQGRAGTFPFAIRNDGFDWSLAAGPDATISYHAVIANGGWHEEGWLEKGGKKVSKVYEANLKRVGSTDWPAGSAVPPR